MEKETWAYIITKDRVVDPSLKPKIDKRNLYICQKQLNNKKMRFDAMFNVQTCSKIDVKYNLGSHLLSIYFNFILNLV